MENVDFFVNNYNKFRNEETFKECITKNNQCSERIIKAHSIQNNRILNKLSKNGLVLHFNFGNVNFPFKFEEMGRKKASTFSGFCSFHDQSIFDPIDNYAYAKGNKEQEFLYAFRSFARGYATKRTAVNLINRMDKLLPEDEYGTLPPGKKIAYGIQRTMNDFERCKNIFYNSLQSKSYYRIETDVIVFDSEYSFAVSAAFYLLGDLSGKLKNDPLNPSKYIAPFFLTVFPDCGKTFVLMSYFKKDKEIYSFLKNQVVNNTEEQQKIIISNMIVMNTENIVFSPDKFNCMPKEEIETFYKIYNETAAFQPAILAPYKGLNIFK